MNRIKTHIKRSISASIFITIGLIAYLIVGNPIGPFLFSFGLLSVCILNGDLFTGKCGYMWRNDWKILILILIINLFSGYFFGFLCRWLNPALIELAIVKISSWEVSFSYFLKSIFCGMIMYIAVDIYRSGHIVGILFGIPLFIFCGFQHCIANIILMGIALSYNFIPLIICIIGNFIGSIFINLLLNSNKSS